MRESYIPSAQQARQDIDARLTACGWAIQDYKAYSPGDSRGIAQGVPLKEVVNGAKKCCVTLSDLAEPRGRHCGRRTGYQKNDASSTH